jgi:hypothetical protein
VHRKIQTRPLVRKRARHQEASTCQTKELVKSGHGLQRAARHQDVLADGLSVANLAALHSIRAVISVVSYSVPVSAQKMSSQESIQEAATKVFLVIVICCGCNL